MASYTYLQLAAQAKHAIGQDAPATNNTLPIIVNRALEILTNLHGWTWRTRISSAITISGGYIDLPADFGELIMVASSSTKRCAPVTYEQLLRARQWSTAMAADATLAKSIFYAVVGKTQANATSVATFRLALAPTSASGDLIVLYRACPAVISSDTDKANIPEGYFDLFLAIVRWVAMDMEKPSKPETKAMWETVQALAGIMKELDGRVNIPDLTKYATVVDDYKNPARLNPTYS